MKYQVSNNFDTELIYFTMTSFINLLQVYGTHSGILYYFIVFVRNSVMKKILED